MMPSLDVMRPLAAAILLLDAGIGVCALRTWQRLMPSVNLRRVILIETLAAALLLLLDWWIG